MKFAFLFICMLCASMLSLLMLIYMTGKIPGKPATADAAGTNGTAVVEMEEGGTNGPAGTNGAAVAVAKGPAKADGASIKIDAQTRAVDDLIKALNDERADYARRMEELRAKEEKMRLKEQEFGKLQQQIKDLQEKLTMGVVEVQAMEQANLKKLSDVCAKMDPASAAILLGDLEKERSARIISMLPERSAAAIMDASVARGGKGVALAAEWTDAIRRLQSEKKAKKEAPNP